MQNYKKNINIWQKGCTFVSKINRINHRTMSDGNYNRALLPSTPYRSGLKMGRQMAHKQAKDAFERVISTHLAHLGEDERKLLAQAFHEEMAKTGV